MVSAASGPYAAELSASRPKTGTPVIGLRRTCCSSLVGSGLPSSALRSFMTSAGPRIASDAVRRNMPATNLVKETSQENSASHPVVQHLQRQVANAFVLYANYKHYHWQTFGPLFQDLHLLFDEFATAVLYSVDDFAERLRMIGQDPVFRPEDIERFASVTFS